jgi:carbon monoxide dehydrogenase subunit G
MSVITSDVMVEQLGREEVLKWLSDPANHRKILEGAFDGLAELGVGDYELTLKTPIKTRTVQYRFDRVDEEHGGRRVHVGLTGKRLGGTLHYSLRTMKPSTNTLITLHVDYDTGGALGTLLDHAGIRRPYETAWGKVLQNLKQALLAR